MMMMMKMMMMMILLRCGATSGWRVHVFLLQVAIVHWDALGCPLICGFKEVAQIAVFLRRTHLAGFASEPVRALFGGPLPGCSVRLGRVGRRTSYSFVDLIGLWPMAVYDGTWPAWRL